MSHTQIRNPRVEELHDGEVVLSPGELAENRQMLCEFQGASLGITEWSPIGV